MKALSGILLAYIFFLIVIPCVDNPVCDEMHQATVAAQAKDTAHHPVHLCSPFCTCACCVIYKIQQEFSIVLSCYSFSSFEFLPSLSTYTFSSTTTIWQPPRLA